MAKPVIECEHCGREWATDSEATRPTCPGCTHKTDRNVIGQQARFELSRFTEDVETMSEFSKTAKNVGRALERLESQGWEIADGGIHQGHIYLVNYDYDDSASDNAPRVAPTIS